MRGYLKEITSAILIGDAKELGRDYRDALKVNIATFFMAIHARDVCTTCGMDYALNIIAPELDINNQAQQIILNNQDDNNQINSNKSSLFKEIQTGFSTFFSKLLVVYNKANEAWKTSPFLGLTRMRDKAKLLKANFTKLHEENVTTAFNINITDFIREHKDDISVTFNIDNFKTALKYYHGKLNKDNEKLLNIIETLNKPDNLNFLKLIMHVMISDPSELQNVNDFIYLQKLDFVMTDSQLRAFKMAVIGQYPCIYRKPGSFEITYATQVYAIGLDHPAVSLTKDGMGKITRREFYDYVRQTWCKSRRCKSATSPSMGIVSLGKGVYREVESEGS